MALLDNMYAPYSHLMQRAFTNNTQIPEDPSITRLNSSAGSNESSPPTVHHNRLNGVNTSDCHPASKFGHYGGTVMTMNLKLEQANFRHFVSHPESPVAAQENNINEDNRKDVHNSKVMKDLYLKHFFTDMESIFKLLEDNFVIRTIFKGLVGDQANSSCEMIMQEECSCKHLVYGSAFHKSFPYIQLPYARHYKPLLI